MKTEKVKIPLTRSEIISEKMMLIGIGIFCYGILGGLCINIITSIKSWHPLVLILYATAAFCIFSVIYSIKKAFFTKEWTRTERPKSIKNGIFSKRQRVNYSILAAVVLTMIIIVLNNTNSSVVKIFCYVWGGIPVTGLLLMVAFDLFFPRITTKWQKAEEKEIENSQYELYLKLKEKFEK